MTERLTEKITDKKTGEILAYQVKRGIKNLKAIQKLGEYETAEEDGRLVVLPCKIGDTVYKIIPQMDNFDGYTYPIVSAVTFKYEMIPQIGKTVFFTREEAEKALEEMKKNNATN